MIAYTTDAGSPDCMTELTHYSAAMAPNLHLKFTPYYIRVSTNLTEQMSRRVPGHSRRDVKKNPGHVCIASACYVIY